MSNSSLKRKLDSLDTTNIVPNRCHVLNEKLSRRPERDELIKQGILYDSQCAPSLQYAEHALKRARLADELNNRLENRPGPLDLIQHNILHIDTNVHPNLEEAIQDGQIPFKTTRSSSTSRRSLTFHEYTGPPSSCKPKITKIDSLSSSVCNAHQIRLAQQQLLLELTSNKEDEEEKLLPIKSLEQMTLVELRDVCKQYQIPSSHANKTKLIERIKQVQTNINNKDSSNSELISSLENSDINENEVGLFSATELDEILKSFPINREEDETTTNDDLFVEMLLNNDQLTSETTFDDLFLTDISTTTSISLPKITSVDEFDAFLRDFSLNISSYQQEVSTPIS